MVYECLFNYILAHKLLMFGLLCIFAFTVHLSRENRKRPSTPIYTQNM